MKLTEKQKKFCDYYIENGGNGTDAALKAEYSEKTARHMACENLTKPNIVSYIKERNDALASTRIADMTEVKEFWANTLRNEGVEMRDRIKVSELIGKTNAAFIDKVELTEKMPEILVK